MDIPILIIGAGASGLMAAYAATRARPSCAVILEKEARAGRKLLATGNGRCNLYNAHPEKARLHGSFAPAFERMLADTPPEALRAELDEVFGILDGRDASRGLDLDGWSAVRAHERHVVKRRAALREAGGGLDILRAGLGHHAAQLDLLLLGQQARFDDDLQQLAAAVLLDGLDLVQHLLVQAVLDPADVDDHVDLRRAVLHGVGGLKALGGGGIVAVGEADDGADGDLAVHIFRRLLHIAGGDADAGAAVLHAVVADGLDLRPCGGLAQQRVIHAAEDIFQLFVHRKGSFRDFSAHIE